MGGLNLTNGLKFSTAITFLIVSICCFLFGCSDSALEEKKSSEQDTKSSTPQKLQRKFEQIRERGEIRVGMQVGYVPFQMMGDKGTIVGLDVDLAGMIASELNVGLRLARHDWNELIPALLDDRIDVIMSGMAITASRNAEAAFTIPVIETGRMFAVHSSQMNKFKVLSDLNQPGVFVVSYPDGLGDLKIRELLPKASYREFRDRSSALTEVLEKRAQAFIDEEFSVRLACAINAKALHSRFIPINHEIIAWAVNPVDVHLLNWLDNFIRRAQGDGRLEDLKKKWFQDYFFELGSGEKKL
jgi:polar amino acid transport system substrate-binding protein